MEREEIKKELINRYKYIYANAEYILAPFMHLQTKEERRKMILEFKKMFIDNPFEDDECIYLGKLPDSLLLDLESFLLSDTPYNKSKLYTELERKKKDLKYLEQVRNGLILLRKDNENTAFPTKLDSWTLLSELRNFIDEQSGDLSNKKNKLLALDEYFRIKRYSNNGKLWKSGYKFDLRDFDNVSCYSAVISDNNRQPSRAKTDIGQRKSEFISYVANDANYYDYNYSILTENEKQEIYLSFNDELPWNLEKTCALEEKYDKDKTDKRLKRPLVTSPCGETFYVDEKEIFVDPKDFMYRYYQLCPHCGYMVNIPKEILSSGIIKRIEERCEKDPNLFEKNFLYSQLFCLDKKSTKDQKRMLDKKV